MKTPRIIAVAVLVVASSLALHVALSQQQGIKRTHRSPTARYQRPGTRSRPGASRARAGSFVSQGSSAVEGKAPATSCLSRREKIQSSEPSEVTRR